MLTFKTLALFLFLVFFFGFAHAKEPEEIWRELEKLPAPERQKRLVEGAKSEGKVTFYGSLSADNLEKLRVEFEKLYPLKLEIWRASGEKSANRLLTEARAKTYLADAVAASNEHVPGLMRASLLGRYNSPERAFFFDTHKDRAGYWTGYDYNIAAIAYNTRLVPAADAPKKYEDFLAPKWKGAFAMDMDSDKTIMSWMKTWGPEKTRAFLQGLAKNEMVVRKGHTLITELLCAGEFKAAVELYAYRLADVKHKKGCPVEIVYSDPTPATASPISAVKAAPHPYAAALLVDFMLSQAGQKINAEFGRLSGRRDIRPKYSELDLEAKGVRMLLLKPEDTDQLGKQYQQLREEFLLGRN
jgi:iron(III) transport system substrate-binding protein